MLQNININPVQPRLSEANISLVARGGPTAAGFNEFTPLFERNQAQLNAAGVVGNENTYGGEGVASMLYNRYSLSAGGFHFETDGWRRNYDVNDNIYDAFAQAAITPELNTQVEVRHRDSDQGDLAFNFDPDNFSDNLRRDLDQDIARAGLRYSPNPQSDLLLSFIYSDRRERRRETDPFFGDTDLKLNEKGYQVEGQYLYRMDPFNVTAGFGFSDVDSDLDELFFEERDSTHSTITQPRGYVYGNVRFPDPVLWTLGVSYDDYDEERLEAKQANPKFGVQWNVTDDLRLRAAVFRTVKPALINNRMLEPTQVAGFNQFFDDLNATKSWRYGVGLDWRLTESLFAGAELTWRNLDEPTFDNSDVKFEHRNEQLHRGYLYWTPLPQVALSAQVIYDRYHAEGGLATEEANVPEKLDTLSVPLAVRYFHPTGFFAGAGVTYVDQDVRRSEFTTFANGSGSDDFVVVDALVGYRFPKRFGIASLEVINLFDTGFNYQDDNFRYFRELPIISRYTPERAVIGRITVNF
jgi:opacity protein-like surface antigen